ncbi:hypothetical protein HD593_007563 [Nonomuraea rubra]|uniref:Uncharacterized protein n=1 Tax=Nonomuraea rubra TaxID=46180 RepID=A0A7X0P020_9ACTN|nr:hypothetical protein [Nonomuraea rubra]
MPPAGPSPVRPAAGMLRAAWMMAAGLPLVPRATLRAVRTVGAGLRLARSAQWAARMVAGGPSPVPTAVVTLRVARMVAAGTRPAAAGPEPTRRVAGGRRGPAAAGGRPARAARDPRSRSATTGTPRARTAAVGRPQVRTAAVGRPRGRTAAVGRAPVWTVAGGRLRVVRAVAEVPFMMTAASCPRQERPMAPGRRETCPTCDRRGGPRPADGRRAVVAGQRTVALTSMGRRGPTRPQGVMRPSRRRPGSGAAPLARTGSSPCSPTGVSARSSSG